MGCYPIHRDLSPIRPPYQSHAVRSVTCWNIFLHCHQIGVKRNYKKAEKKALNQIFELRTDCSFFHVFISEIWVLAQTQDMIHMEIRLSRTTTTTNLWNSKLILLLCRSTELLLKSKKREVADHVGAWRWEVKQKGPHTCVLEVKDEGSKVKKVENELWLKNDCDHGSGHKFFSRPLFILENSIFLFLTYLQFSWIKIGRTGFATQVKLCKPVYNYN